MRERGSSRPINKYRIPHRQWIKWSVPAQHMFNDVYGQLHPNQANLTHPEMVKLPRDHWKTIAWNAAWISASAVVGVNEIQVRKTP